MEKIRSIPDYSIEREYRILRKDGQIRWVHEDIRNICDDSGKPIVVQGAIYDITERKRAEEDLRDTYKQLLDIIEFLPDATFVISMDKKVIAWNRAMEEMTGVRKEEVMGKGDYAYAVPFYGVRRPMLIDLVLSSDEEIEARYDYIERKGNTLITDIFLPLMYQEISRKVNE